MQWCWVLPKVDPLLVEPGKELEKVVNVELAGPLGRKAVALEHALDLGLDLGVAARARVRGGQVGLGRVAVVVAARTVIVAVVASIGARLALAAFAFPLALALALALLGPALGGVVVAAIVRKE
jgi:hypothetical protein